MYANISREQKRPRDQSMKHTRMKDNFFDCRPEDLSTVKMSLENWKTTWVRNIQIGGYYYCPQEKLSLFFTTASNKYRSLWDKLSISRQ